MNKLSATVVTTFVVVLTFCIIFSNKLNNQNLAIVQSFSGDTVVRRDAGWWVQCCPTIWRYPKAGVYQLNSNDRDSLQIQFNNKSKATLNVAIGYRIDYKTVSDVVDGKAVEKRVDFTDDEIIALHQQVEGEDEKIWKIVLTCLNTVAQSVTTKYDPSDVIGGEKFDVMIREMYTSIIHNSELQKHCIDINYFAVDGRPIPDKDTEAQFNKQREADLAKRLAQAEKLKLESEKIRVEANYAKEIAEFRGRAEAETAKLKTEAERTATLATIEAQRKVDVEKLAKEQLLIQMAKEKEAAEINVEKEKAVAKIQAEKILEVAEIQKKTEAAKLEAEKLVAEQKKVAAEAKKIEIEKSGAITELQKMQLEVDMKTKIGVAEAYAKGIAGAKLPAMWVSGGNGSEEKNVNPLEMLINMMTLEKLGNVTKNPSK
jgi:hypothetical protein